MGITFTKARISNPRQPRRRGVELEFLIDTAICSVVPGSIARKLALANWIAKSSLWPTALAVRMTSGKRSSNSAIGAALRRSSLGRRM
jgi:hypothetical protein